MKTIHCLLLAGLLLGCSGSSEPEAPLIAPVSSAENEPIAVQDIEPSSIETFSSADNEICRDDGKPIIRLFSTTWCSHCQWIADTYDAVAEMYIDDGEIVAYHWELDTGDDMLTDQVEQSVPDSEIAVFTEFNPRESIPTFVFGCKYYRVGNGHELADDLSAEAAEFMAVIEALIY